MPRVFKRCLAVINTRSGSRDGRSIFASALQYYLDRAGIVHRDVYVPEQDTVQAIHTAIAESECVIVCGGDGTVSSVVNVLATAADADLSRHRAATSYTATGSTPTFTSPFLERPLLLVPAGLQNSIAHSLGIQSAERAVSAFVMGRREAVPLWEVRVNGALTRYICSYIAIGTYAEAVRRFHALDAVGDEYVALPMLTSKFSAAALYTCLRGESVPCQVELRTEKTVSTGESPSSCPLSPPSSLNTMTRDVNCASDEAVEGDTSVLFRYAAPIRMLLAAQMPLQHGSYSLCPDASFKSGQLSATIATREASRLRLWHLFKREAAEGYVLNEDGVHTHRHLSGFRVVLPDTASDQSERRADGESASPQWNVALDGEMLRLPAGSELTVRRASFNLPFLVC